MLTGGPIILIPHQLHGCIIAWLHACMEFMESDAQCQYDRGDLKIAVLINEVGSVDVDSLLVNAKQVSGRHAMRGTGALVGGG